MITSKFFSAARLSRVLTGGAALAFAAAISSIAPATALAQGKANFNGGTGCANFTTFTYDAATNTLTLNCTGGGGGTGPSVYSVVPGPLSVTRNTDIATVITRSGGAAVAETLTLTHEAGGISGWNFNGNFTGSQTINFAAGEYSKTLNFYSGPTDGWLRFTLASVASSVASTASGSQTINVAGEKVVAPPVGGVPGCSTTAAYINDFTVTGQKFTYSLKPGETAATSVIAKAGLNTELSTSDTVNTPPGSDHEITLTKCPGDFSSNVAPFCRLKSLYKGGVIRTSSYGFPDYYCQLVPGDKYYMNVRQVNYYESAINSCTNASCEIKVQIQGY